MNLQTIHASVERNGLLNTFVDLVLKGLNRNLVVRVLKAVKIEHVNPKYLQCDARYEGRFLNKAALGVFADVNEYELSPAFLDRAFAKGDECYGFLSGGTLAAYGWYSRRPTAIDIPGLVLRFRPDYTYMYKGFTHPKHRGQRLHAVGMTRALEAYLARGQKGIVSYVEETNFDSLRSCYRMGYEDFGRLIVVGVPNHYILHASRGCRSMGFMLKRAGDHSRSIASTERNSSTDRRFVAAT